MSQTNSIFNTLFNRKISTPIVEEFTSQDLYLLYLIFKSNGLKLSFFQFYNLLFSILKNFRNLNLSKLYFILYLFFSTKTDLVYIINSKTNNVINFTNNSNLLLYSDEISLRKVSIFWNKFKKLRRPITENTFNDFFLKG